MPRTICQSIAAVLFVGSHLAASGAFAQISPLNPSKYRIIPAPEFSTGYPLSARGFNWIDSNRLIFVVNDKQLSATERRGDQIVVTQGVPTIHVWDFGAGTITRYRDEPLAHRLCAVEGRVWYGLKRGDRVIVFEGKFGEERERELTPLRTRSDGSGESPSLNAFSCTEYWGTDLPRPNRGFAVQLRDEHGTFERAGSDIRGVIGTGGSGPPFKYWNHRTGTPVEIPLPEENANVPLEYSFLAQGYLFHRRESRLERGIPNRFYLWLPSTNTVRQLDILGSENWNSLFEGRVTRAGLVAKSSEPTKNLRAKWDVGPAGIYLFSGSPVEELVGYRTTQSGNSVAAVRPLRVEQIIRGLIDRMSAASPDGCKIAVVVDPWDGERRRYRFEVIDFCSTRG